MLINVSFAVMKPYDQKQFGEENVHLFGSHFHSTLFIIEEVRTETQVQGRNLEVGADIETLEGCCLLAAFFPWLAQLTFS